MRLHLTSLPVEILIQICKYLPTSLHRSVFRLVCRVFSDVGLHVVGSRVTLALMPGSIARLHDISSHAFFRHHTSTLVCLMNIFYPYGNFYDWKKAIMVVEDNEPNASIMVSNAKLSNAELDDSWYHYRALCAAQKEAYGALDPWQNVENVCRRFTNLKNIDLRFSDVPSHIRSNQTYQYLIKRHPGFAKMFEEPALNFNEDYYSEAGYIGLPAFRLLRCLLSATSQCPIQSLRVEALAVHAFGGNDEHICFSLMKKRVYHLRTLELGICIESRRIESTYVTSDKALQEARQIMSSDRLRTLLCSGPCLEDVELKHDAELWNRTGFLFAKASNILPRENTWPRLRRLALSQVEIETNPFLQFIGSHAQTLRTLKLQNCEIVPGPGQLLHEKCRWSDIIIPLATSYHLTTLSLHGVFVTSRNPIQNQQWGVAPPYIDMHDIVQDVDLAVGHALAIVACSKEFENFLLGELAESKALTVEAIKKDIIQDLVGSAPPRLRAPMTVKISTRHVNYLKSFSLIMDSSSWEMFHENTRMPLEAVEVPWMWREHVEDMEDIEDVEE
jgi:hypothetical protein